MNWLRESDYHLVSEDRAYTICKFSHSGEWLYEVWDGKRMVATRLPSADAAKAVLAREGQ